MVEAVQQRVNRKWEDLVNKAEASRIRPGAHADDGRPEVRPG